jgi:Na+/H+-dicarboxylate symporter
MAIMPLVFTLVVTGIASAAGAASAGGLAARALLTFIVLLAAGAAVSAVLTPALLSAFPPPADATAGLREALSASRVEMPLPAPLKEWLPSLIPTNPFAAAANGAVLQLVVFALVFGFALLQLQERVRRQLLDFFQSITDAMLVIVHWVLLAAPFGVFALALVVSAHSGLAAAGTLAHYVAIVSTVCAVLAVLAYPLAVIGGRIGLARFVKAAAPAQVVALSTQSSLAALPAMVESAREELRIPTPIVGLVLPMATALFRVTSPAANLAVAIYVAHVSGVHLSLTTLILGALVAVVISFAGVGIASQVTFFSTLSPICMAMGVPLEMLALLIAVETIPDIMRTVGNVTMDMAATALLAARGGVARVHNNE